jgi:DNA-damage-inducible protein D
MNNEIQKNNGEQGGGGRVSPFERIKRTNEAGVEFWSSRDFAEVLDYGDYRNFEGVVEKAKLSCFNSGQRVEDHFVDVTEMIEIGKGGQRPVKTIFMSRYACYLAIQNADPKKEIVALGQTYFAAQTRRQELADQQRAEPEEEIEGERRLLLRHEMRRHNAQLADAAKGAGVIEPMDYAIFQNHGYMGLYGGLTARDIHHRKGLKKSQEILDHIGSTELAANLFRATQAEEKLRRERVRGKDAANRTHHEVGRKVRQTIKELGGTMPEDLPSAESIKKLETKQKKRIRQ